MYIFYFIGQFYSMQVVCWQALIGVVKLLGKGGGFDTRSNCGLGGTLLANKNYA